MTGKVESRFEEAEKWRGLVLAQIGLTCGAIAWMVRGSTALLGAVALVTAWLMTGDRYQWIYIGNMTWKRDLKGLRALMRTMIKIALWERSGTTVVTRFAELVKQHPDKKAFIMGDRSLTYKQGEDFSTKIAWYFKRQGFKQGEVIALFMETQPEYVFIWLGLAKLRVISALVNTNLRGSQLIHCLKIAGCKAVVFGDELSDAIREIQKEIPEIPLFQFNSPENASAPVLQNAVPLAAELNSMTLEPFEVVPGKPRETLLYIYTSGTTGFPKAAIIPNVRYLLIPLGANSSALITPSDIVYDPLPLHHTAGGVLGAGQALIMGSTVVLRKKFSARSYWSDCAKHECTVAQYIGEICRYLLNTPPGASDKAHKVTTILGNGMRPQLWEEFVQRFNIKKVVEFYGATEGNSNLINLDNKVGAIGFLSRLILPFYPMTLVRCDEITGEIMRDSNGRCIPCKPWEPGLLLGKIDASKAITTFAGYADKTASEKKMVRGVRVEGDCYFNTGDILVMDYFGYFYFRDRTGDTFRWRGENVSTAEVEGVISKIAELKDTVVYGVSIPNVEGRAGMAAIADPNQKLDLQQLARGLRQSLPVYARPLFVRIVPEPPLTVTYKLKKKDLIEQGYNPELHNDPIYFMDPKSGEYIPMTQKLYQDIVDGVIRL